MYLCIMHNAAAIIPHEKVVNQTSFFFPMYYSLPSWSALLQEFGQLSKIAVANALEKLARRSVSIRKTWLTLGSYLAPLDFSH